jgi:AraC-like DNA-binding protein
VLFVTGGENLMSASNNPLFHFTTGDELSGVVPELIVLSSREQGWKGLELVQFRENLKELAVPALSSHVIIFGIENSHSIRAKIGESVYQGHQKYSTKQPQSRDYPSGLPSYKLRQVIEYIQVHLEQDLNLTQLAELVGLSQYYFVRLFKQSVGVAPYQYVLQCRVERAKQLLQKNNLAIAEVALCCGFADQNHLTRVFRRLTGTTPKAYRDR